ncbi:uncharacterized protein LOC126212765 [Schistocerca nitens]|uniref:uncharacterized protein LOC126212765 n=1 Tax=Schistocerca nitens TaxID=7011 RepID=UPI0021186A83|nr:uncharacterized protein LOC126212765 [Schistocerca nitens]
MSTFAAAAAVDAPNSAFSSTTQSVQGGGGGVQTAPATQDTQSLEEEEEINLPDWSLSGEERGGRLIKAAMKGAVEEVWTLLAAGVDVDARNGERQTALHWTAWERHVEVVRCLVEDGADVDARDIRQKTPQHNAAWRQEPTFFDEILADLNQQLEAERQQGHLAAVVEAGVHQECRARAEVADALIGMFMGESTEEVLLLAVARAPVAVAAKPTAMKGGPMRHEKPCKALTVAVWEAATAAAIAQPTLGVAPASPLLWRLWIGHQQEQWPPTHQASVSGLQ